MNKLEKFFNTLSSSNPRLLKSYTTEELISQIKEYVDFTPYIVKNVYKLLISHNSDDRKNGANILKSLMFQFKLVTNFKIEYIDNKDEYLGSTGEEYEGKKLSMTDQKKVLKEIIGLQHVDTNLVTEIDFKSDSKISIKKQKVQDKPIENINDFFDNLTNNLLNYEWNKRHGAFLDYCAIFESETTGDIEIKIDASLFLKIYEILKSDKFTDFVDDQATAPVREAAACLLGGIYPRIPKNNIIDELLKFLDDTDWQTQYSGLLALSNLKSFITKKEKLCKKLQDLLSCKDEDVKFLTADLLIYFYDYCDKDLVYKKCIENLQDNEEISISKVTILTLLSKYNIYNSDITFLYNYFTSPIQEVRSSVLKLSKNIKNDSITFLLGEIVLLDDKDEIRNKALSILKDKELTDDFINHFILILGNSLYEPYDSNLFVSYDDMYFTKSGIKALGKNIILNNRVKLFNLILKKISKDVDVKSDTMIGDIFIKIIRIKKQEREEIKRKKFQQHDFNEEELQNTKDIKPNDNTIDLTINDTIKDHKIQNNTTELHLKNIHSKFKDLILFPIKELENKIQNPDNLSLHPLGESVFIDFLRWISIKEYPEITDNFVNYYKYETSREFLIFFTDLLVTDYDNNILCFDMLISQAYKFLLLGYDNFLLFFDKFGSRIFNHTFYQFLLKDTERYKFFSKTIKFYSEYLVDLRFLYEESISLANVEILQGFLTNLQYTEDFIDKMLQNINLSLLDSLISFINYSFYSVLVKPLLGFMSSSEYKDKASKIFSYIIPRLNFRIKTGISQKWIDKILESKKDLECLLDNKNIEEYKIKCPSKVVLRKYQEEGVKWINFLYSFHLNGILADDMGLGKTIQVLSFVCSEIYKTDKKVLIICPSSLTGHWNIEITNFFADMKPSVYKRNNTQEYNILIISYDSFRNDYESFIDEDWFYVILDEGHVLRNSSTLLYQRISKIRCRRRLILTGTPVHNSVEDLISLFNLLMPNYLGSIKNIPFMSNKMSDNELKDVHSRLEELNKKILPFILRRLKVDVLKDLPPKIIRDIIVEMGVEQRMIYNNININKNIEDVDYNKADGLKRTRELINAASHISYYKSDNLPSGVVSCKVKGLEDIINLYGGEEIKNKILIFFQYKTTIDFVIQDFKKKYNLKFLRLDGSVPSSKRAKIASDFNTGNIPIMFLTTHVGGLGLNLTGADTVIFYEHDWNPFNDLQAMDRAHRIGQKNTVNVFRLITKDSIEEKVMSLQNFKMFIASSIVTQQNADIETMNTKDLLERFGK